MNQCRLYALATLAALFSFAGYAFSQQNPAIDFDRDIKPIFQKSCYRCHGPKRQKSGLRLDKRASLLRGGESGEPAIVPGKGLESHLIKLVSGKIDKLVMPPTGKKLTAKEIKLLTAWIDFGAKWSGGKTGDDAIILKTNHWSFQPIANVTPPKINHARVVNPIDAFVIARLNKSGLELSPPADRVTLIRRLYLDMHGLPPTPQQIQSFVSDKSAEAYEKLIDVILASPRYGERWAQHWLDVVRYADTFGYEMNRPRPNAWPYRDYVIQSFNDDKPYNRFILEQLAGDAVGADAATGFLVAGPQDMVRSPDPKLTKEQRQDELNEMITATAGAFLGLTIGCARCHNHKFDPILQKDYYAVQAIFAGVNYGERPLRVSDNQNRQTILELNGKRAAILKELRTIGVRPPVNSQLNEERFEPVNAKHVRFIVNATNNGSEPCIDELEIWSGNQNVALASTGAKATSSGNFPNNPLHKLEHINDGKYGNSRSWISNQRGKGWVQITLAKPVTISRIVWGRDRDLRYLDRTATDYRVEASADGRRWTIVASSGDRVPFGKHPASFNIAGKSLAPSQQKQVARLLADLATLEARLKSTSSKRMVFAGMFVNPDLTRRLYRGDPLSPREVVKPDTLTILGSLNLSTKTPEQKRRFALAKWIARKDNPLTARVMVNRIWHYHFGKGIVSTPNDFGKNGGIPSHPQLLDWLAQRFVSDGWSVKKLHRLILLSSVYRQASSRKSEIRDQKSEVRDPRLVDAGNRLLWRFPQRRLEAEAIRDSMLFVSGALNLEKGGPGFDVFKPNTNYVRNYVPKDKFGPSEWRRMIYVHRVRMEKDATFGAFDCPDAGQPAPRRSRSTTAIQALNLFNSSFVIQQAEIFAKRVQKFAGGDVNKQIITAFALALGREPSERELKISTRAVQTHGLPTLCRVLFNTNEFLFLP